MNTEEYILRHIDAEGDYLHALWRDTQLRLAYGQMASGHLQGRLLKMMVQMIKPRMVLELGTFSGYSALSMAEGLEDGAELHTFEIFDEQEDFIRQWFDGSPYAHLLHLHIGDALELVPRMDVKWDLAFIDADKSRNRAYYDLLVPRMRRGGFILIDNVLWSGKVLHAEANRDRDTQEALQLNEYIQNDPRTDNLLLPVRDGLMLCRVIG